jgi:hypothetical protein
VKEAGRRTSARRASVSARPVVAELIPPGGRANGRRQASRLAILVRTGLLVRGNANDPTVYRKLPPALKHEKSSRLLDQERGGR